jgi:hypothetical protein
LLKRIVVAVAKAQVDSREVRPRSAEVHECNCLITSTT